MKNFSLKDFLVSLVTQLPARDWFVTLSLFIVLFAACIAYAVYLFLGIRAGTIVGSVEADHPALPAVSRVDLSKTLDAFRTRKANYDARNFPRPALFNPAK